MQTTKMRRTSHLYTYDRVFTQGTVLTSDSGLLSTTSMLFANTCSNKAPMSTPKEENPMRLRPCGLLNGVTSTL